MESTLPNVRKTLWRGVWLGVQSSLLGSAVFLVTDLMLVSLVDPWFDAFSVRTIDAGFLFWMVVFLLAGFVVAVGPGAIGGSLIGLVLRMEARHGRQSPRIDLVTGLTVGACSGGLAIQIAKFLEPEMVHQSGIASFIAATLSAAIAGVWHAWRFARWLQRA